MRPKSVLLLLLALGCGLIASIGISQVMDRKAAEGPALQTEEIFVVTADVNIGEPLTEEVIKLEAWPKDKIAHDAMRVLEDVIERRPRTKLFAGEQVREAKLMSADEEPAEIHIPPGYRTVTVNVDAASGNAGLLKPGSRVDVQLFVKKDKNTGVESTSTQTILQDVRVFAVDQKYRRSADEEETEVARTISLIVTPQQADKITLASELGKVRLIMRHPDDDEEADSDPVTIDDLLYPEKSDREAEREKLAEEDGKGGGLLDALNQMQNDEPAPPDPQVAVVDMPGPKPHRLILITGPAAQEFVFNTEGGLPQQGAAGDAGDFEAAPTVPPLPDNSGPVVPPPNEPDVSRVTSE